MISQQVSSLNCLQWLTRKCTTNGSKYVKIRDPFCMQLFISTFCMNSVYRLCTSLWCTLFIDQNWCIQNVYKMFVYKMQASAYEVWNRMPTPLHMPKILETCKKNTPCLIQKASRCAADHTSKTTTLFNFHFPFTTKILGENHVYLFISLVQWWKLYYTFIVVCRGVSTSP